MPTPQQNPSSGARATGSDTAALFVRIPVAEAEKLDRAAFELGARKRDLVTGLVARYVDPSSRSGLEELRALGGASGSSGDRRRVTVETADDSLAVGRHSFRPAEPPEVMNAEQVAELLQTDAGTVERLAARGDLPARKVGAEWRFARQAVLDWLAAGSRPSPEDPEE